MSLTALSPLDGRYESQTSDLTRYFSEFALIRYRVRAEIEWLRLMAERSDLPDIRSLTEVEQQLLTSWLTHFDEAQAESVKFIEKTTRHDVKAVEYYLKERMTGTSLEDLREFVHFCCTSEDINNLSHALMLKEGILKAWLPLARQLVEEVTRRAEATRNLPMLSRTHGQPATPSTIGKELAVFAYRWERQLRQLESIEFFGKFNGAVGNYNAHVASYPDAAWEEISRILVERLGLTHNPLTTQIESHDYIAELFHLLIRFNTITLDFDRDMWTYISMGFFRQKVVSGEAGSSVMPHKVNPIDFENSEANAGISTALLEHLATKLPISRLQRDLSDSSALRNLGVGIGHSLLALKSALNGLSRAEADADAMRNDLKEAWEVLAEPIQTVMRKNGFENPYERLKEMTRGETITRNAIHELVCSLNLPPSDQQRLLELSPETYLGLASQLVRHIGSTEAE